MQEYTIVHNYVLYHVYIYSIRALIWNISEKAVACSHKSTTHQCTFSWDPKFLRHMYTLCMCQNISSNSIGGEEGGGGGGWEGCGE